MQFIFDHIQAIIIASVIVLILIGMQMRNIETSIDDTSVYISKTNSLDLAKIIEEDLMLTLHRSDRSRDPFVWPTRADGRTVLFEFYRDSLGNPFGVVDTFRIQTRYALNFLDSLHASDGVVPIFEIVREECLSTSSTPCGGWEYAGSSAQWVTDFDVTPLRLDKSPATNVAEAHYVDIRFTMASPLRTDRQVVEKMFWSTLLQVQPF